MKKPDPVATQLAGIKSLLRLILGVLLLRIALDYGHASPPTLGLLLLIFSIVMIVWAFFAGLVNWARHLDKAEENRTAGDDANPLEIDHPADKT